MSRPVIVEDAVNVSLKIEKKVVKDIDKLARKLGLSRSRLMRNLLLSGWDDARGLDALGVFTLVLKAEELMGRIRDAKAVKAGVADQAGVPA